MSVVWSRALLASAIVFSLAARAENPALDEVVVVGTRLREQVQIEVPASVTVLSAASLHDSAQQHFEEVMAQAPNLNWAAGSTNAVSAFTSAAMVSISSSERSSASSTTTAGLPPKRSRVNAST